ncbi:MAG: agmatine deiminase family protein [Muribaculaceae bacterium]
MTKNKLNVRMPAEWERSAGVIVAWPHADTDWRYMLPQIEDCYVNLVRAIARHAVAIVIAPNCERARALLADIPSDRILFFEVPTNDTWTRDYGVISTVDGDNNAILNDFAFNAWGGKFEAAKDNAVTAAMVRAGLLRGRYNDCLDFYLEGGSIESDGRGTLLTTTSCLLTDTRNAGLTREQIEQRLERELGAHHVLWLESGAMAGDDTDGHIDTLARLAPDDTILYVGSRSSMPNDPQSALLAQIPEELARMRTAEGNPFNLIELPLPDPIYDDEGMRLPATYANYLVVNEAVLMPTYNQPLNDDLAAKTLRVAFPNHVIETVDCQALIQQHGSLHCATMQLPENFLCL